MRPWPAEGRADAERATANEARRVASAEEGTVREVGVAALSVFGAGVAIPILYGIFYKMMWTQGKVIAGLKLLALIIVLGCGLLSVILFAKANEVKETPAKPAMPDQPQLHAEPDTRELLEQSAPETPGQSVGSVYSAVAGLSEGEKAFNCTSAAGASASQVVGQTPQRVH